MKNICPKTLAPKLLILVSLLVCTLFQSFSQKTIVKAEKLNIKDSARIKKEVMNHIESIFKAFVTKDTLAIRELHSADWTGFQQFNDLKRDRNGYMQPLRRYPPSMTGYNIDDYQVQIFTDVVLVYYEATIRNLFQSKEVESQVKSLDVYQKRRGNWIQIGCHIASKISFAQYVQMRQAGESKN